jgi:hypothetical protein
MMVQFLLGRWVLTIVQYIWNMEITDEQKATFTPAELKTYLLGEIAKFRDMYGSLSDLPDIFELESLNLAEDASNELMKKYDKIFDELNKKVEHIPKRFRK